MGSKVVRRARPSEGPVPIDFDDFPDGAENFWRLVEYSYTGQAPWSANVDPTYGSAYRSITPNTTERYKVDFAMKTKWNEPEDGSGRIKYGVGIKVYPAGLNIIKTIDIAWTSAETVVDINESFEIDMVAGTQYYFMVEQDYEVQPSADISGYQLPGSQITISTIGQ